MVRVPLRENPRGIRNDAKGKQAGAEKSRMSEGRSEGFSKMNGSGPFRRGVGFALVLGVLLLIIVRGDARALELRPFGVAEASRLLSSLVFIALFVERALEVFVAAWRDPGADERDLALQELQKRLSELQGARASTEDVAQEIQTAVRNQTIYRTETKKIALRSGLALGVIVSAVGFRVLAELVSDLPSEGFQGSAFALVDIFLTGAVIAGGADGIHKIANLYGDFMDSTSKRIKGGP